MVAEVFRDEPCNDWRILVPEHSVLSTTHVPNLRLCPPKVIALTFDASASESRRRVNLVVHAINHVAYLGLLLAMSRDRVLTTGAHETDQDGP